jgi:4-hydroxybenzoyl-CoA reductase subunit beta
MTPLSDFRLVLPATLSEAIAARHEYPGARLLAGGTDIVTNLRHGICDAPTLIDITGLPDFQDIAIERDGLHIGAGVTLERLSEDPLVTVHAPALAEAARQVAGPAHRTVATLGGNLCLDTRCVHFNQSAWWRQSDGFCLKYRGDRCRIAPAGSRCHAAYSGDTAPVLLVLGATVELGGGSGKRRVALESIFNEDGAAHLGLGDDEVLLGVRIPTDSRLVTGYEKARLRGAIDFPIAGVAVSLRREEDRLAELRIAVTGTNSRPILLSGCEALVGLPLVENALQQIDKLVQKQVKPMRTTLTPAHCRRRMAAALAVRLTRRLWRP